MRKFLSVFGVILLVVLVVLVYWRYYFVYAEGTKAGVLNTIQKKGMIFKTFEGRLIQTGFGGNSNTTSIQSNYFDFSVGNERVGKILLENSGKNMELHYNRYFGALPWRGTESYVVDSVYEIEGVKFNSEFPVK